MDSSEIEEFFMQATLSERGIDTSKYDRNPEKFLALLAIDSQHSVIAEDIWEHGRLQQKFDAALGRRYSSKDMLTRSYNPVTDRWRIEKLRRAGDKEGEEAYKNEIRKNIETNLRERLQVGENVIHYRIKDKEVYSEDFPGESFTDVLHRGAAYRLAHGSGETEREGMNGELGGWKKILDKFTNPDTPVGTKMTIFSPPGMVKDSVYDRQLVDEHELAENDEGRYWKVTRKIVDFDEADYYSAALSLDPHYFDEYDGRPLDAWSLSHPVEGTLQGLKIKGMSSATFDTIYQSPMLQGLREKYVTDVSAGVVNWKQLALDMNAILNQTDEEEDAGKSWGKNQVRPIYVSTAVP